MKREDKGERKGKEKRRSGGKGKNMRQFGREKWAVLVGALGQEGTEEDLKSFCEICGFWHVFKNWAFLRQDDVGMFLFQECLCHKN